MLSTVPFLTDPALPAVTLFTAQGRYGNNALNGDWELGITSNTNKPPQKQIDHIWKGSVNSATGVTTVRDQFTFGVSNTTAASFRVGGSNISFDYAGQLTGNQPNAIKIWAKASTANSGLTIDNLKLTTPGVAVPMAFPGASIAVSRSSGPDFQQLVIAGVDFTSGSGPAVELTGNVLMSFGAPAPRGSSLQFHVMTVYVPPVDLDVNSDNDGTVMRSAFEELEEDAGVAAGSSTPTKPGLIVPVGGPRAEMVVEVPAGRTATLALSQGTEWVQVYAQPTGGAPLAFPLTLTNTALRGSTTFTYWIEAVAPSESMADIAFTLTTSDTGPASSDTVRATAMADNYAPTSRYISDITVIGGIPQTLTIPLANHFDDVEDALAGLTFFVSESSATTSITSISLSADNTELQLGFLGLEYSSTQITIRAVDSEGAATDQQFAVVFASKADGELTNEDQVEAWYQRNRALLRDDIINRLNALIAINTDEMIGKFSNTSWIEQQLVSDVISVAGAGVGAVIDIAISFTAEELESAARDDGREFIETQAIITERMRGVGDEKLREIRDDLVARLKAGAVSVTATDITASPSEKHMSELLQVWWSQRVSEVQITPNPGIGGFPDVNIVTSSANRDQLRKIIRAIRSSSPGWHFYDGGPPLIHGRTRKPIILTPEGVEQLNRYEQALIGP
jgi:hypothetical protein